MNLTQEQEIVLYYIKEQIAICAGSYRKVAEILGITVLELEKHMDFFVQANKIQRKPGSREPWVPYWVDIKKTLDSKTVEDCRKVVEVLSKYDHAISFNLLVEEYFSDNTERLRLSAQDQYLEVDYAIVQLEKCAVVKWHDYSVELIERCITI